MEENLEKAEAALADLIDNFPNRAFACLLRVLVLPLGRRHRALAMRWMPRSPISSAAR